MKSVFIVLFVTLSISITAQSHVWKEYYYPNGVMSSYGLLKNGKPEGYWKSYYPNGIIKSEGNRFNHVLDSIWNFYDERGKLLNSIDYKNGKKNGYSCSYLTFSDSAKAGILISKELYLNNGKNGSSIYYREDGSVKEVQFYLEGDKDGNYFEFDTKGIPYSYKVYKKGILVSRDRVNRKIEGLKEGKWIELYENYYLKTESNYRNGILDGIYKEFDEYGKMLKVINYESGIVYEGDEEESVEEVEFRDYEGKDGAIVKGAFKKNVPRGIHRIYKNEEITGGKVYSELGVLIAAGKTMEDGKREGTWELYYPNGRISSVGKYKNGKRNGDWRYYYESGSLSQKGNFSKGKLNGSWVWFFESGDTIRYEEYEFGYKSGLFQEFNQDGILILNGYYLDDYRDGTWRYYVGDHIEEGKYLNGLKEGKWKHYFGSGELKFEGNYIQGSEDGKHKYYYLNGLLKEERYYISGYKEGNWKKYNMFGENTLVVTYRNDEEVRVNGLKISEENK